MLVTWLAGVYRGDKDFLFVPNTGIFKKNKLFALHPLEYPVKVLKCEYNPNPV
ncbi:MAG: hypothetical protein UZ12_BCD005002711 [Bacteroidetes bacterium OLB12]|nr:MAG: hypothetical protein UZ12_BCD005002711 [Bacteroidetes bacterium OLB12]